MPRDVYDQHTGLTWHVREGTDDHLLLGGHEPHLIAISESLFPKGGIFVDVGAHVGMYTCRLARKAKQVVAIEANPKTAQALQHNVVINGQANRVRVVPYAAWDVAGEKVELYDANGTESGGSTGAVKLREPGVPVGKAPTTTVDMVCVSCPRVDLVKIDVEGAEARVLAGARKTLARHRPTLIVEMHDCYLPDPEGNRAEVERTLADARYVHGEDLPFGEGYHWIARPKEQVDAES